MYLNVAIFAQCYSIIYIKPQFRIDREWFNVVCVYITSDLSTMLASVIIPFKDIRPPRLVLWTFSDTVVFISAEFNLQMQQNSD